MLSTLLLCLLTGVLLFWWLRNHFGVFRYLNIPGPDAHLILGNMLDLLREGPLAALNKWQNRYGDVFGYFEGHVPVLVIADPELVKQMLVKDFYDYFPNRKPFPLAPRKSHTLFLARGKKWKRIRNILTPTFSSQKLKRMAPIINGCVDELLENLDQKYVEKEDFDIFENYQRMTLDVIGRCALGLHFTCQANPTDPFLKNIRLLFSGLSGRAFMPIVMVFPVLRHVVFALKNIVTAMGLHSIDFLMTQMKQVIRDRKQTGQTSEYVDMVDLMLCSEVSSTETTTDFLDRHHLTSPGSSSQSVTTCTDKHWDSCNCTQCIDVKNVKFHGQGLTEDEIISQSIIFLLAGYETTSTVIAFVTYVLATMPDVQQRVCQELDDNIQSGVEITYDMVQALPYLDKVFSETCRMYPTAGLVVSRQAARDWRHGDLFIPAGMYVQVHVWGLHHDPRYWRNPHIFDPERFSPERKSSIHPFAYLPFGAGPRNCIGARFGDMEAKIAVVRILQRYTFVRCQKTQVPLELHSRGAVIPKHGVFVRLKKR